MNLNKAKFEDLKVLKVTPKEIVSNGENILKNVYFKGETLSTRPGTALAGELIFNSEQTYNNYSKTIFTDCYYYKNGQKGRVLIVVDDDDFSEITYHFYIAFSSGDVMSIGRIDFVRTSEDTFGRPETFTLYTGKKTRGSGIYFMVRLVYFNGEPDFVRLFELNEDMSAWESVYSDDIYVPTVLAFGRGQNYKRAEELIEDFKFSAQAKLESENILTNRFFAYYTADGYSSAFKLPYAKLGNEAIHCHYNYLGTEHYFKIEYGKNYSEPVTIGSDIYRLGVFRETGVVYFVNDKNANIAPLFTGVENNLKFLASRPENDDLIRLGAMSNAMSIPAGREGSGNQTVVFYGNTLKEGGKICWINSENPLYFPKDLEATPGNISNKLLGAFVFNNALFVYDNENLYSGKISTAGGLDLEPILNGVISASKVEHDKITFNKTVALPEEMLPRTVVVLHDRVVLSAKNGGIYELTGNKMALEKVADLSFYDFIPLFAVSYKGGFLALNQKDAYYYDPQNKALFYWRISADTIGGFGFSDECLLFANCLCNRMQNLIYAIRFEGDSDWGISDFNNKPVSFSALTEGEVFCNFNVNTAFYKRLNSVIIEAKPSASTFRAYVFADGKREGKAYIEFKGGNKTIRYGDRFKRLTLHLIGSDLSFISASIAYLDGKVI